MTTRKEAELEAADMAGVKKEYVVMSKFSPVPFANDVLKSTHLIYDKYKRFWRYDNEEGIWKLDAEQYLKTLLRKTLMGDEQQKRNYVDEVIAYLKDIKYDDKFEPDNDIYLVPCRNKIYDIRSGEFKEFSPDYFITNKIDIEITGLHNECPVIDKFFADSMGEDYKEILYDLAAYCLFRDMPYQKIFFVYGPAGTGKSRYLEFLELFLGKANCCSVEPQRIQQDKHATAEMHLKLANIVSDINYDALDNINQVKKLSGGDTVVIRQMYKEGYGAKIFAKQIYSTNKLPAVKEKTNAWYRRVYLMEFSNIINQNERDPFIISKMTTPKEMEGFLIRCLKNLTELNKRSFVFKLDIDEQQVGKLYEELSNPILRFINENCIVGRDSWTYKYDFEDRLQNWLEVNHLPKHSKSEINQYMREVHSESNRPAPNSGKTYRVWSGLRWKTNEDSDLTTLTNFTRSGKQVYILEKSFMNPCKSVKVVKSDQKDKLEVLNLIKEKKMLPENSTEVCEELKADGLIFEHEGRFELI